MTDDQGTPAGGRPGELDAIVVGAGFAGLYMLHRLRGLGLRVRVFERGDGVGGTWYWNRYPGARCDVDSIDYSFSFDEDLQQEWVWTERFARQDEILRYAEHVADRFGLRADIRLGTTVTAATWDDRAGSWEVATDRGDLCRARWCIMATGALSAPKDPEFEGLESFRGVWYQTGRWPQEGVRLAGRRVGVIGTGSTGIQLITEIAPQVAHLDVFQRTPNFSVPQGNRPLDPGYQERVKTDYPRGREDARSSRNGVMRTLDFPEPGHGVRPIQSAEPAPRDDPEAMRSELERRWAFGGANIVTTAYADVIVHPDTNAVVADFVRDKIRATVHDQAVAEALLPHDHPIATKRICADSGYYATFNRDNVTLVDLRRTPIETIVPEGIRTTERTHPLDVIVFATGFDAMTGALLAMDLRGRDGVRLRECWAAGPQTYLGLAIAGFPNLFTITGPASPSVLSNVITSIEQHVDWIAGCIAHARDRGVSEVEATPEAQERWMEHVAALADGTLFPRADSWYMGANVPGKPRVMLPYVGGVGTYRDVCDEVAAASYEGFALDGRVAAAAAAVTPPPPR
ncbi:NAD(P)/FAD-dependent oxidoreductase [Baekduia soli]|uniref:NAD(P)/FAD-dependent oxidoreductase n=1 Tax=Baekduia soli TaxID=496014 RepID=A0A5B8U512_9ACTN|nr:NAD(P)/FAD-dependent oxidoreductase [Baekduia soli]QEC48031.1 NAD(P)/FAD-dependent oxidoreductase [Baekduia soli]